NYERTQPGEFSAATACIRIWREQRMVKEVVHVCTDLNTNPIVHVKILVQAKIHAPRPRPPKHVALCHLRIAENVRSNRGRCEGIRIPDLATAPVVETVVQNEGAVGRLSIEVANGVE